MAGGRPQARSDLSSAHSRASGNPVGPHRPDKLRVLCWMPAFAGMSGKPCRPLCAAGVMHYAPPMRRLVVLTRLVVVVAALRCAAAAAGSIPSRRRCARRCCRRCIPMATEITRDPAHRAAAPGRPGVRIDYARASRAARRRARHAGLRLRRDDLRARPPRSRRRSRPMTGALGEARLLYLKRFWLGSSGAAPTSPRPPG